MDRISTDFSASKTLRFPNSSASFNSGLMPAAPQPRASAFRTQHRRATGGQITGAALSGRTHSTRRPSFWAYGRLFNDLRTAGRPSHCGFTRGLGNLWESIGMSSRVAVFASVFGLQPPLQLSQSLPNKQQASALRQARSFAERPTRFGGREFRAIWRWTRTMSMRAAIWA